MTDEVFNALQRVFAGNDLTADEMQAAIGALMDGRCEEVEVAALLTALKVKGESVEEITGAARAMRERSARIETKHTGLLDTCGTGGDSLHTLNISTATAIVAAACGIPIAKHGNRSVSSSSGSADVLETLGVNINLDPGEVGKCLDEVGIAFCFARLIHGAMKYAAPIRKKLRFRTIFNLLGPLTNPAGAEFQLLGVNEPVAAKKVAGALAQLGSTHALVVCGNETLDEVSLWGHTDVFRVNDGSVTTERWTPADFGLPECEVADLKVSTADESASVIRNIFAGKPGPARDIVVANSAAALLAAQHVTSISEAAARVHEAIDSGQVAETLERLVERSNS